jgi:NAD(P)-dependent dehydrogenase (short-subunit alcohol dehydrogenase family)
MQFENSTALVTGGAQGIGLAICKALARAGAKVAVVDNSERALARARQDLSGLGRAEVFQLDVRDRDGFAEVADRVETALGPVSLLFNNAGVGGGDPASHMSYSTWDWVMGINVGGVINGIQTFAPRMIARRQGHIVNTASGAGLAVDPAWGIGYMYPTSKYAVVGLSESLRLDLAEYGIGVSVLCPGPVATDILSNSALAHPTRSGPLPSGLSDANARLQERGLAPERVAEMVLRAIRENRPYILTHRMERDAIEARFRNLLAAVPEED